MKKSSDDHISLSQQNLSDPAFFEAVFRQFYTPLCKTVYRISLDKQATEDIVQDLFVKLWNTKDSVSINTSLKSYLYRAAINATFNYLEKNKKLIALEAGLEHFEPASNTVDEQLAFKELQDLTEKALNALPPACRTVFVLSREEELSYKEIAEMLNISVKTVENQMIKALRIIREKLDIRHKT